MSDEWIVRIEYSEDWGGFHVCDIEEITQRPDIWKTVCKRITDRQAIEFCNMIHEKYPHTYWLLEDRNRNLAPSISIIKQEFEQFLLT